MVKAWGDYELKILSSFLLILKSMIMRVGNLTLIGPWFSHLSITSGKKALITHRLKDLEVLKTELGNNTIVGDNIKSEAKFLNLHFESTFWMFISPRL